MLDDAIWLSEQLRSAGEHLAESVNAPSHGLLVANLLQPERKRCAGFSPSQQALGPSEPWPQRDRGGQDGLGLLPRQPHAQAFSEQTQPYQADASPQRHLPAVASQRLAQRGTEQVEPHTGVLLVHVHAQRARERGGDPVRKGRGGALRATIDSWLLQLQAEALIALTRDNSEREPSPGALPGHWRPEQPGLGVDVQTEPTEASHRPLGQPALGRAHVERQLHLKEVAQHRS